MIDRDELIAHIMFLKSIDEKYASWAARFYQDLLPGLSLGRGLSEAIQKQKTQEKSNG